MVANRAQWEVAKAVLLGWLAVGLAACGGGSSGGGPAPEGERSITGIVEKGPFTQLQVDGVVLDASLRPLQRIPAEVQDNRAFSLSVPAGATVRLEATGRFRDELSGEVLALRRPLSALNTGQSVQNINVLSQLLAASVLGDVRKGLSLASRLQGAQQQLASQLGFPAGTSFDRLDTRQIAANAGLESPDLRLALLSAAVMSLPRDDAFMPAQWDDLIGQLEQGGGDVNPFSLFAGLSASGLLSQLNDAAVVNLPTVNVAEGVWECTALCEFANALPGLRIADAQVFESRGRVPVTLRRNGDLSQAVNVLVLLEGLEATAGQDYAAERLSLTIPAGESVATAWLDIVIDAQPEGTERLRARIFSTEPGALPVRRGEAVISLVDGLPAVLAAGASPTLAVDKACLVSVGTPAALVEAPCLTSPPAELILGDSQPQALRLATVLQSRCVNALSCSDRQRDWQVSAALVLEDAAGGELGRALLGEILYPGAQVVVADGSPLPDSPQFTLGLESAALRDLLARPGRLFVELRLDNLPGSTQRIALPGLRRLSGEIRFGDRSLPLLGVNASLDADDPRCGAGEFALNAAIPTIDAGLLTRPELSSGLPLGDLPLRSIEVCVRLEGVAAPEPVVTAGSVDVGPSLWALPPGHGVRLNDGAAEDLLLVPPAGFELELAVDGLPLAFRLTGGSLDAEGLALDYSGLRYLQRPGLSAQDPRVGKALYSNDAVFAAVANAPAGRLRLGPSGLNAEIAVPGGEAALAFPEAELQWGGFSITLTDSQWSPQGALPDVSVTLAQSADCREPGCPSDREVMIAASGTLTQDAQGRLHGSLRVAQRHTPGFGLRDGGDLSISRPDDLPAQAALTAAWPGFSFAADAPVAAALPGHIEAGVAGLRLHDARSAAFRLGNFAPVGLSLGPETYSDAQGQPQTGSGQDLSSRTLRIDNGGAPLSLPTGPAAKYVLRRSGISGVFNVAADALSQPLDIYGYPVAFSRFAFRFKHNAVDPFNWLDGRITLAGDYADPGRGIGQPIVFSNLAMDCSARFGQGNLVFERCDALDNNLDGVTDENCPAMLASFGMAARLHGLRFAGADGAPPAACADGANPALTLGHSLSALALDKPLSVELGWTPAGELAGYQAFRGLGEVALEGDADQPGFGLALDRAELAVDALADGRRYGHLRGQGLVALPFWRAVDADFRLANDIDFATGMPRAGESVLAPAGVILPPAGQAPALDLVQDNAALNDALAEQAREADGLRGDFREDASLGYAPSLTFPARYEWGHTGIGFQLPVYFTSRQRNADSGLPTFIGVERGFDAVVLSVGAGVNFIEPQRTKISFGASADITALQNLDFQVDLASGAALSKVDATLLRFRVIDAPVVEPTFSTIQSRLNAFNRFANSGVDDLTEAALLQGIERLGARLAPVSPLQQDPVETLAQGMATLRSLPDQLAGVLEDEIRSPLDAVLSQAESRIRAPLLAARAEIEALQAGAPGVPAAVFSQLESAEDALRNAHDRIDERRRRMAARLAAAADLVASAQARLQQIDQATTRVITILEQSLAVVDALCQENGSRGVELAGYLDQLFGNLDDVRTLLSLARGSELLIPLIEIAADDPALAQSMRDAQAALQNRAELLGEKLTSAETAIRGQVCGSSTADLLAGLVDADGLLTRIQNQVAPAGPLATGLATVTLRLTQVQSLSTALDVAVLAPLDNLRTVIADQRERLQALDEAGPLNEAGDALFTAFGDAVSEALALITPIPLAPLSNIPLDLAFDALVLDYADDTVDASQDDLPRALLRPVRELLDAQLDSVRLAAAAAVDQQLPGGVFTADELRRLLVGKIMQTGPIVALREVVNEQLNELRYQVNGLVNDFSDQANTAIKDALARASSEVAALQEKASAQLNALPLSSAAMDGYATIAGNELERLHIGAEFALRPATEGQPANTFGAALDAVSWSANDKTEGCNIAPQQSPLEVTISAFNLPARFGTSAITMKKVYLGFVLDQAGFDEGGTLQPLGVFGGLSTQGEIAFTEFKIYDPAFAAGFGRYENYLGAAAGAVFSTVAAEVAFLVGKTCNQEVLLELDPQVAQFIPIPDAGFAGAYVRGAASVPVWTMGCPLTVGVAAEFGAWVLAGPPLTVGGIVGGGAFGKVGCVGALRGQIRALGQVNAEGDMVFVGEGFGAAGVGLCEPAGWSSVERSRQDGLCVTGDARFQAGYVDDAWQVLDLSISAPH